MSIYRTNAHNVFVFTGLKIKKLFPNSAWDGKISRAAEEINLYSIIVGAGGLIKLFSSSSAWFNQVPIRENGKGISEVWIAEGRYILK